MHYEDLNPFHESQSFCTADVPKCPLLFVFLLTLLCNGVVITQFEKQYVLFSRGFTASRVLFQTML